MHEAIRRSFKVQKWASVRGIRDVVGGRGGLGTTNSFSRIAKHCGVLKGELSR